ncbi:hypothetical protein M405DRAFT_173286 [Rhizopogon salebrosus TDB-379]|nr:hypothetical protein M405DRAFT_173286 [Rhizopogon salebrosus TDB-379]
MLAVLLAQVKLRGTEEISDGLEFLLQGIGISTAPAIGHPASSILTPDHASRRSTVCINNCQVPPTRQTPAVHRPIRYSLRRTILVYGYGLERDSRWQSSKDAQMWTWQATPTWVVRTLTTILLTTLSRDSSARTRRPSIICFILVLESLGIHTMAMKRCLLQLNERRSSL